jgi:agmatine deiminase
MARNSFSFTSLLRSCLLCATLLIASAHIGCAPSTIRVPAEWEPQEALWLQWPGPWEKTYEPAYAEITKVVVRYQPLKIIHGSNEIKNQARAAITAAGGDPDHPSITYHLVPSENAWMRDNGPVYVIQDGEMRIQNWEFDAWGGAFEDAPYAKDNRVPTAVGGLLGMPVDHVNIVHERGNLEFNGVDTVILNWNVIGNSNRGNGYASKDEAEIDLRTHFGVTKIIWADGPITGDRTAGHIDGIARFIDKDRVVVANCTTRGVCQPGDSDDQVFDGVAEELAKAGFEVIRMDFEAAITYAGDTFDADYMNWGVGNGWVILVGFNNPASDNAAKAKLEEWFPGRDVYVIEMLESWIAGGGVHCHTNDQPAASTIETEDGRARDRALGS